ncbi:putative DNA-binding transcriptional regulator YafY [Geothermobacter ehrlichii]|uniref:Putative DNA-binding transcriptional regulator YafY n=1 Tax=Geothermobacter ehrlichii TaxID=213224 RepID=A0A5D3WIC3_9BACT|nr:WYL domain-containing protein [Geothermobacter ehrlichii]TYO97627.1 putative DNA-binding transcriptional regulator YafY [Geothermobacter ehrlichii]
MAGHLKFIRYYWFDRQVRAGRYPNATTLAEHFEISTKTAQRNIDYMRDQLAMPLEYDSRRKGYYYTDVDFSLPALQVSQNELLAILLAQNLLADSAGGLISREIERFGRRLFAATDHIGLGAERIATAFSAVWNAYTPADPRAFRLVADSLLQSRRLQFHYFSPASGERSERLVEPYHLQHYLGSWVLLARCCEKQDWRKFNLGRMSDVQLTSDSFTPLPPASWKRELEGAFGLFQGLKHQQVVLHFNAYRARWIRHEIWHPEQEVEECPDGSLILRFKVADLREIKLRVLQFGADVEVLAPEALRREIVEEAQRISGLYAEKNHM